jgi:transcriptional regulator with XRE-family HTH domain
VWVKPEAVEAELVRRNLSQNHLALKAKLSKGYLSQLMRRQRNPGPDVRGRLMKALHIQNFDELFIYVRDDAQGAAA